MTDARTIVYRLRAVADPSSAAVIKKFGDDLQKAMAPKTRMGGDAFGKIGEGLKTAAKAAGDLDKQMAKVNAAHNRRMEQEERGRKKNVADIDKEIAALKRREAVEEAAAKRAEEREHRRHRLRQRSIAMQNRQHGAWADGLPDYKGGGPVDRGALDRGGRGGGMGDAEGHTERAVGGQRRLAKEIKHSTHALIELGHGFAQLGVLGEEDTEKLFRGLLKVEGVTNIMHGLRAGGPVGAAGALAAGGVYVGGRSAMELYQASDTRSSKASSGRWGPRSQFMRDPESFRNSYLYKVGSTFESMGGGLSSKDSAFGFSGDYGSAANSLTVLDRARRQRQQDVAHREYLNQLGAVNAGGASERYQNRQSLGEMRQAASAGGLHDAQYSMAGGIRANRSAQDDVAEEIKLADETARTAKTESEKAEAKERSVDAQKRMIGLLQEEQRLTKETLDNLREQRKAAVDDAKGHLQKYNDVATNFGNLSDEEQRRLIRTKRSIEQAGPSKFGRSVLARHVSREDASLLASIGGEYEQDLSRRVSRGRAERGGFEAADLGKAEQMNFNRAIHARSGYDKLIAAVQPPKVEIEIKPGVKEIGDPIVAKLMMAIEILGKDLEKYVKEEMDKARKPIVQQGTQQGVQKAQQAGSAAGPNRNSFYGG